MVTKLFKFIDESFKWDMALGSQVEANGKDGAVQIPMVNGNDKRVGEITLQVYFS